MEPNGKRRRLNFFVQKSLQLKFVFFVLFLFLMSGLAVWREASHAMMNFSAMGVQQVGVEVVIAELKRILLIKMLIEVFLIIILTVVFSHVIAGPLHHLQQVMKAVAGGDYSVRLQFRRLDELKSLARTFNEMMERISGQGQKHG